MYFSSSILALMTLFFLTGSMALTAEAAVDASHELPGLSIGTPEKICLAADITDNDEEANISDPGEQSSIGDPGEQATVGDPGESATVGDPGEQSSF
jgi:hypothetical protein